MIELTLEEVLEIHSSTLRDNGGSSGIRDDGALESALAQPFAGFGDYEAYPTLQDKAAALGFSLVRNHPFVDGNKRTGFQAMDVFLRKHGYRIDVTADEGEDFILSLAAGEKSREELVEWIEDHLITWD